MYLQCLLRGLVKCNFLVDRSSADRCNSKLAVPLLRTNVEKNTLEVGGAPSTCAVPTSF